MQPVDTKQRKGSPTTKPCANSEMSGTAKEPLAADGIKSTVREQTTIKAGPVPLYLIPQTLSSEIHAHGGDISGIAIKRTGQHVYAITLTKTAKQAIHQSREQKRNQGGTNAD